MAEILDDDRNLMEKGSRHFPPGGGRGCCIRIGGKGGVGGHPSLNLLPTYIHGLTPLMVMGKY